MTRLIVALVVFSSFKSAAQTQPSPPMTPAPSRPGLSLTTAAFDDGGFIPIKYTMAAERDAVSPRLTWTNVPDGTVTFALILSDSDTSISQSTVEIVHWMIFNIPQRTRELPEGVTGRAQLPDGSIQALNQTERIGYMGMAAKAAGPYHHYNFELFALDTKPKVGPDATRADLLKGMNGHILMKGVFVGRFHLP
jgi:Raf kinase inhibitor-like YbhB/YbcL family protein